MEKPNGEKDVEIALPVDRRSKIKEVGDQVLDKFTNFKTLDGVEEEFLYEIPKDLRVIADIFEAQVKQWDAETSLSPSEISVTCGILRKARLSAEDRRFMELADWLSAKEGKWKTKLHWRKSSYGMAILLSFLGITTGYGISIKRWLLSIAAIILAFAGLAYNYLDYGSKQKNFGSAVYWSIITISTLGYGDITPQDHSIPKILASAEAVIGLVMFIVLGMLIGDKIRRR